MFIISPFDCLLGTIIFIYIRALFECRAQGTKQTGMSKHSESHLLNVKVSAVIKGAIFLQLSTGTWADMVRFLKCMTRWAQWTLGGNKLFFFTSCFVRNRNLYILIQYFGSDITAKLG